MLRRYLCTYAKPRKVFLCKYLFYTGRWTLLQHAALTECCRECHISTIEQILHWACTLRAVGIKSRFRFRSTISGAFLPLLCFSSLAMLECCNFCKYGYSITKCMIARLGRVPGTLRLVDLLSRQDASTEPFCSFPPLCFFTCNRADL